MDGLDRSGKPVDVFKRVRGASLSSASPTRCATSFCSSGRFLASPRRRRRWTWRGRAARGRRRASRRTRRPSSPETLWVRWAAWQPLLFEPGTRSHYSNIGYDILGLIAARAGGKPLPVALPRADLPAAWPPCDRLRPAGPDQRPARPRLRDRTRRQATDTTNWHWGVGADGGIVSNAEDTATFLTALMRGKLLDRQHVAAMEGDDLWRGGTFSGCAGRAYGWSGGGSGYKTDVWVDHGGGRVAGLLLNARHFDTAQPEPTRPPTAPWPTSSAAPRACGAGLAHLPRDLVRRPDAFFSLRRAGRRDREAAAGVVLHELGHEFGLEHSPTGSSDWRLWAR